MQNETGNRQRTQTRGKVRELLSKQNIDGQEKSNAKRERFLAVLKSRYGYTNERAIVELERLLKQFYRTNRSIGIRRARMNFIYPLDE